MSDDSRSTTPENAPSPGTPVPPPAAEAGAPVEPVSPVPPVATPAPAHPGRSAAIGWGIVLVVLGMLLLAGQLLPHVQFWRYWPLIVVALGVRQMFGPVGGPWSVRHLTEGISTVVLGLVFLGQMLGYLSWDVWLNILRLWPLLLVALGLEVIGKGLRSDIVRALGSLVIAGGLAYGALVMSPTASWPISFVPAAESTPFKRSQPHSASADTGRATIDGGAGRLSLAGGPDLATAEGSSPFRPRFDAVVTNGRAEVTVAPNGNIVGPIQGRASINVTLDRTIPWDLTVKAGVSEYDLDLREIEVSSLHLESGVSSGVLTLGVPSGDGATDASIEVGVSSLTVRVPKDESTRVTVTEGLTSVSTSGSWKSERTHDTRIYTSDGFDDSGAYWNVQVRSGIGDVKIEYY